MKKKSKPSVKVRKWWGTLKPATKIIQSKKLYKRSRSKKETMAPYDSVNPDPRSGHRCDRFMCDGND